MARGDIFPSFGHSPPGFDATRNARTPADLFRVVADGNARLAEIGFFGQPASQETVLAPARAVRVQYECETPDWPRSVLLRLSASAENHAAVQNPWVAPADRRRPAGNDTWLRARGAALKGRRKRAIVMLPRLQPINGNMRGFCRVFEFDLCAIARPLSSLVSPALSLLSPLAQHITTQGWCVHLFLSFLPRLIAQELSGHPCLRQGLLKPQITPCIA
jgi:hypothetical protein